VPDYWGATADPNVGYSPYSGMTHYSSHNLSTEDFTSPPGDGTTGPSIELLEARIHNMHPERIAALADQWQNAYTVMSHVRDFVFLQSTVLHDENWKSPAARNAFMEKGPGQALVYLDKWMDAAMTNVTVLRHLEVIAQQARDDIDEVVRNYKAELSQAKANVDYGDQVGEFIQGLDVTWTEADQREV
jgi:hypothetical protein